MFNEDKNPFLDRTKTSFDISIGTGMALESLFEPTGSRYDVSREIPNIIKPEHYKIHVFNIFTIARNILSACSIKDKFMLINNKFFLPTVLEELETISALYSDIKATPILYMPDYTNVFLKFNKEKEKVNTNSYIDYETMRKIFKGNIEVSMDVIDGNKLPASNDKVLVMSSYTFDLLNYKNVPNIDLLESHTGKVKTRSFWSSKYHAIGKADLSVFPFLEELLYVLGDRTLIRPTKVSFRKELHELAIASGWHSKTTRMKVISDISKSDRLKELLLNYS